MMPEDRVPLNPNRTAWDQLQEELGGGGETPCQSHPDLWFNQSSPKSTRRAVELCETECELRDICRAAGRQRNERYGVWGGLSSPDGHPLPGADAE